MWFKTPEGKNRLMLESELLIKDFPQFRIYIKEKIIVEGVIEEPEFLKKRYKVRAEYPDNYDKGKNSIVVYLPEEDIGNAPHQYPDGRLSLEHCEWEKEFTICNVLFWTIKWLAYYEDWRNNGNRG